ncbi:NADPH-dependent F420 reductase [Cellulomonas sp. KRMCY2]|uniref:NADPH-dependent F420 reductase n=1 Tax=Cellulomonas sp. KRMCY2 TaxID=1304865 RepID=UPI0004A21AB8|nr:NADPH-dependent F420 reductase [Cellulomonas sp. KRMCY2]
MTVTIIGAGSIGQAVAGIAVASGHAVQILARDAGKAAQAAASSGAASGTIGDPIAGDVVVLAVPYPAVGEVLGVYAGTLAGKVLVDVTNPLDFSTFDSLVVPADGSAAAVIQALVPEARVVKAFNTTFAATLATRAVGGTTTTVLIAGDDADAKTAVAAVVEGGGLIAVDAGSLRRARELESLGFLQLTLAATEKIGWTGGFALVK